MTEGKVIANRSEIVFLYDIKDANPNGDPMDENKPRIDEETEINIVTDVRLKRTIRDYLSKYKEKDIFIIEEIKNDGTQKTREERIKEKNIKTAEDSKRLLSEYIDLRLFGATLALSAEKKAKGKPEETTEPVREKGKSFTWIGPVQFRFGRSLHKVVPQTIKGTSVMPSKEGMTKGTFIETQILPYSLISFYGIINENAAKSTGLTEDDVKILFDGIWNGTKNLITRSKIGQAPRFLMNVVYKKENFHIGDLDKKIKLVPNGGKKDKEYRSIADFSLNANDLIKTLENNKNSIERIELKIDDDARFFFAENKEGGKKEFIELLKGKGITIAEFTFN